jgi:Kef-type K+ transport system membrane component KefB
MFNKIILILGTISDFVSFVLLMYVIISHDYKGEFKYTGLFFLAIAIYCFLSFIYFLCEYLRSRKLHS